MTGDRRPGLATSLARNARAGRWWRTASAPRRRVLGLGAAIAASALLGRIRVTAASETTTAKPERRWYEAAEAMRRLALSWGDQSFGAVLVLDGTLAGEGPSRVVKNNDVDAHAEREAIRDAQRRLGRKSLAGAVLYSTSRPCRLCEAAAREAEVARMIFGPDLTDAGAPRF